jgi:hypothetical protein
MQLFYMPIFLSKREKARYNYGYITAIIGSVGINYPGYMAISEQRGDY